MFKALFKELFSLNTLITVSVLIMLTVGLNSLGSVAAVIIWNSVIVPAFGVPTLDYWTMFWIITFIELIAPTNLNGGSK